MELDDEVHLFCQFQRQSNHLTPVQRLILRTQKKKPERVTNIDANSPRANN